MRRSRIVAAGIGALLCAAALWAALGRAGLRLSTSPPAGAMTGTAGDKPMDFPVRKPDEEWKKQLTPLQYEVTRQKATERAFTGEYWNSHEAGLYRCVCCGAPLFRSDAKFDSVCGWPSFFQPVSKDAVGSREDTSFLMVREEILCARCGAHLGHVFDDGPPPTGLRYCINSASLRFEPDPKK